MLLKPYPVQVKVEGFADSHTDDLPIQSSQFPSNWELAARRATCVTHELIDNGMPPSVFTVVSYGEYGSSIPIEKEKDIAMRRRVEIKASFQCEASQ